MMGIDNMDTSEHNETAIQEIVDHIPDDIEYTESEPDGEDGDGMELIEGIEADPSTGGLRFDTPIDMEVLNHLLFHQAIGEGGINIDKYLDILRGITEGDHLNMMDPKDRTTALVFELVLNEDFNPWDIDLKRFSITYLKRLSGDLDFITAGRLIFMAYRILRLQSAELLESLSEPDEDEYDDFMEIEDWMEGDESYVYTRRVVEAKNPPIEEAIMHRGDRRVTLFELVEAFNEAAVESEEMREHNIRMRAERNRLASLRKRNRSKVGDQVHDEDFKEDIRRVHSVLRTITTRTLTFNELLPRSPIDKITTFIALLFLNFEEQITIKQKDFPYGEIIITLPEAEQTPGIVAALGTAPELATEA